MYAYINKQLEMYPAFILDIIEAKMESRVCHASPLIALHYLIFVVREYRNFPGFY